ncbi:MAG: 50S ribosomal protein L29 [Gammaproteobacteria bacterium]|nr:50S ribosomal protein L29 [Gammaproteobacteria bacterium]
MKVKDIRAKDVAAMTKELEGLLKEQFNLRMQRATGQLSNHAQFKKVRRDIARIKTVMNEKTKGGAA